MAHAAVVLDVSVEGCDAELYVNDVPVTKLFAAAGGGARQVDHLLVRGDNLFEVVLHPGATPSVARTERRVLQGAGVAVAVHAALCPSGTSPGDAGATTLFRFGERLADGPTAFPRVVATTRAFDPPHGPWAWESADVLALDRELDREATAFVRSLHGALARKSFVAFWAHNEVAHREVCLAYEIPLARRREGAEAALAEAFADPSFAMAPLAPDDFDFRLVARGRLLECVARDYGAVVKTEPDATGAVMRFPLMLGRLDGSLRGLR